jgi:hypothetical protein
MPIVAQQPVPFLSNTNGYATLFSLLTAPFSALEYVEFDQSDDVALRQIFRVPELGLLTRLFVRY